MVHPQHLIENDTIIPYFCGGNFWGIEIHLWIHTYLKTCGGVNPGFRVLLLVLGYFFVVVSQSVGDINIYCYELSVSLIQRLRV